MAAPNYQLLVNGVDLSYALDQSGWNVTQNFGRQGTTAHMHIFDDYNANIVGGVPTPNFVIKPLQSVVLKTTVTTNLDTTLFSGRVTTPNFASPSPGVNDWILDCVDYTNDTDNVIVSGDYNGWTADEIIKDLVSQANAQFVARGGSGLSTSGVNPGPTIQRVQINYLTLSTAIVKVVRLASQFVDYAWFIDYNRNVNFFNLQGSTGAPIAMFSDNIANGVPSATNGYFQGNYAYVWDGGSLRNSIIVRGTTFQTNFHDTFVGNGSQTSWPLTYHVTSQSTAGLSVAGAVQTVEVLDNVGNTGAPATSTDQFIITQNSNGQWFLQVNGGHGVTPAKGAKIALSYTYDAPILARADNAVSQSEYTGTNGGLYQGAISDSSLVTLSSAVQRGQTELQSYQWIQERVTFTTIDNWPGHINAGQTFNLNSLRTPDSQNAYAMGLVGTFICVSNAFGGTKGNYRGYTITATRVL